MEHSHQGIQHFTEVILKLHTTGNSTEEISALLGVSHEAVMQVLSDYFNDPRQFREVIETLQQRSREFRCSRSGRLMRTPVLASDGKHYEQSALELGDSWSDMSDKPVIIPNPDLQGKVKLFCKSAIDLIDNCLKQRVVPESALQLAAECLSVLSPDSDLQSYLKVLTLVGADQLDALIKALQQMSSPDSLRQLLCQLIEFSAFHPSAVVLAKHLLLISQDFETDFRGLLSLVRRVDLTEEVLDLCTETASVCSAVQLRELREALTSDQAKSTVHGLMLREAKLCLAGGNKAEAKRLVESLSQVPQMQDKLMEFYDQVGWEKDKAKRLTGILHESVSKLRQEGASEALLVSLHTLGQLSAAMAPGLKVKEIASKGEMLRQELEALDAKLREITEALESLRDSKKAKAELREMEREDTPVEVSKYPEVIYSYTANSGSLHWTTLSTGKQHSVTLPSFKFKFFSSYCELPGGNLYFTGGYNPLVAEVVSIDTRTFAVTVKPPMISPRSTHSSVYFRDYLYVLGGFGGFSMRECERYCTSTGRWEAIPPLNTASRNFTAMVIERSQSIYALGGYEGSDDYHDLIQEFSVERHAWKTLDLKMPSAVICPVSFKLAEDETKLYFVQGASLYVFRPQHLNVRQVRDLSGNFDLGYGASYFSSGYLYCASKAGAAKRVEVGNLE
jgi:hypothetical protein